MSLIFAFLASENDNSQPMSEREEDDDDDDDDDLTRLLPLVIDQALIERVPGNQINDWEFKSHFQLGSESLELLCQKLSTSELLTKKINSGRPLIPFRKQVVILL